MGFTRVTAALAAILIVGVFVQSVEAASRCECRIESRINEGDEEQIFSDVVESAGPEAGYPYRYISKNTDQDGQHTFVTFRVVRHEEQTPANCAHTSFLMYFKTFQTVLPWLQYWQSGVPYLRREVQKGEPLRIGTTGEVYKHKVSENLSLTVQALNCRDVTENSPTQSGDSLDKNESEFIEKEDISNALTARDTDHSEKSDGSFFVEESGENASEAESDGSLSDEKNDNILLREESAEDFSDSEGDESAPERDSDRHASDAESDGKASEEESDDASSEEESDDASSEEESDEDSSEEGSEFRIELFD